MSYCQKVKDWFKNESKYWATDVTGLMCEGNMVFATLEKYLYCMSDNICIANRAIATANAFLGIGYIFSAGLDLSDRLLKIDRRKKGSKLRELGILIHDSIYAGAFTIACSYLIYSITNYSAGSPKENKEILESALFSGIVGGLNGGPAVYSRDILRDLVGLRECNRSLYPNFIKKRNPKLKKILAAGFVATCLAITAGIIKLSPDNTSSPAENITCTRTLEEIVE